MTDAVADPLEVAQRIADQVRTLLNCVGAAVYRVEEASGDVVAAATSGDLGPTFRPGLVFSRGTGIVGLVVRDGRPVTTPNVLDDPRVTLTTDHRVMVEVGSYRSVLAVPLVVHGAVIGALSLGAATGRVFTEAEVTVVQAFADQAASAIENARLYQESTVHQRRLATMVEVARKLTSRLDLASVLSTVAEAAEEVFRGEVGFRLVEGDELVVRGRTSEAGRVMVRERIKIGESISGRVAATGEPIVTTDVSVDPRVIPEHRQGGDRTGSLMCVPIRGGSRLLGTLNIYRDRGQSFDAAALDLAMSLADQAGIALENARLHEEAQRRRREAEELARVARTLTESLSLPEVGQRIVESVIALFGVASSSVRMLQSDHSIVAVAAAGRAREHGFLPGHVTPAGQGVVGRAVALGEPVWTPDLLSEPWVVLEEAARAAIAESDDRAFLAIPLRVKGDVVGVLSLSDSPGRIFSQDEVKLAAIVADHAAIALDNARLYRDARRAYEDLSRTQQQLLQSQKMEAVGRLAGGIAHDFNNLLTVIQGRTEILLRRLPSPDRSWRDLDAISRTAERAGNLTRQLLAFSRRQTLQPRVLDLNAVVGGMHAMLRQLIGEDIDLQATLAPDTWPVMADRGQLEQVMVNLTVNARDAMPAGGRLVIETGNAGLDEALAQGSPGDSTGAYVFFRVSDSGMGIDSALQPSIFEPFFTTKGPGQGTGLGLSTVDGIVRQHGGFVTVCSAPGQGAIFTVYLPRAEAGVAVSERSVSPGDLRRGTETILLVEDEEEVRDLAQEVLRDAGFTVLAAGNGAAALELARQHQGDVDLLLTDVVMPGMDGVVLAGEVRRTHPEARILYMSGYPAHPSGRTELLGVDAPMVTKPFTTEALTGMVRQTLDAGRAAPFSPGRP